MSTAHQRLLDRATAFLEAADGEKVQLSVAPGVDVCANVGQFRRERYMESTAYQWIEYGTILIRRSALARAGVRTLPDAGQQITARGKTYRIKYSSPDSTGYSLDCVNIY